MKYGLQLYSVRDAASVNFEDTLRRVAEMGYNMVETAGFYGLPANEVKAMLDHYGLEVCSTHTSFKEVFHDFYRTLEYHKSIGCKNIILPSAPTATREDIDYTVANINRLLPLIEEEGMKLHYHNHSREFMPNSDGLIAEEELAKRTAVLFELDTFWVFNAGLDPVATMEKYRDRSLLIHLKDGIEQDWSNPDSRAKGRSTGSGHAPVAAVRAKAIEMGLGIVIESEGLDPTGPEEAKRCIDFLRSLDAKDGK